MRGIILALAIPALVAAVAPLTIAAAPTPATPVPNYYPLKVGTEWHHRMTVGEQVVPITLSVAEEETIDGIKLARLEGHVNGKALASEHLRTTDKGLFRYRYAGLKVAPPLCLLRYPVKDGETWETAVTVGSEKATMTCTIGKAETEVPAGKYEAVTVEVKMKSGEETVVSKYWFAEGIGIIRQEVEVGKVKAVIELEKAVPGP